MAWAGEHADRAYADIEGERDVVVGDDPELPPVPPELAERLRRGPRRPARDAWRDRPEDSPPMRWEILVDLGPPDLRPREPPRAGARRARGRLDDGVPAPFVVTAAAEAPTYRPVLARVRKAVGEALEAAGARPLPEPEAAPIEGRWRYDVDVHPPDYEWSPLLL